MSDTIIQVTDSSFTKDVLQSKQPVVVDFWATWCRPCLMMAPTFEAVSKEYAGKVTFAKMDTDENQDTPMQFYIQGIPTMILFKDGQMTKKIVGAMPKRRLEAELEPALA